MQNNHSSMGQMHYSRLLIMAVLSFIAMYILMYTMVNVIGNVYNNFNQFYMAEFMTAPMVIIELIVMRSMYPNKRLNLLIITISAIALVGFFQFHPAADCHCRQAVPAVHDPASFRGDLDVRTRLA